MTGFFGGLGYSEQLPEIRLDPSSTTLRRALSEWLNGPDRQASDTAVIYYSGHGDSRASSFYLLTADSKENRYADTALRADYVLEALGETPKVRRLLLILDACYAGHGAFDAADVAARMWPWQNFTAEDEGVWVVAAASPKQEAQERLFVEAFIEAAEQLQQTTGTLQPYIGLEALIWQINAIFQRSGKKQRVSWIPVTQARGLAPFIPNARYEPDGLANVDLETRDRLRRQHAAELAEYWGPKARGVEVAAQAGWYFTGRKIALAELTAWLADAAPDTRLRVVTGDPGSGKSAVLGRLVTLANTSADPKPPGPPADSNSTPPAGSITAALLARGKTADELRAELAASLDVAPSAELADTYRSRSAFTVVIDALDEATDPPAVIKEVISPLVDAASHGRGPRLLVATRRDQHLLESLPEERVTVDLDQDIYRNDTDLADYVTKLLLAADDPESLTPYRGQPGLARLVADQVAAIAGHSFLIAQIAARTLARTPRAFDPAEVSADRQRWSDVGAAFDRDLDRYGEKAQQIRDLLTPLAWAEGAGLPRELWAPLATVLADDEEYTQADISWLIGQAGFYLVEILEQDRSVYRLYHEQFAEHLRATHSPTTVHERITAELLRHVPVAADGRHEWLAAAPYIRTHLAIHAAKGRLLDQLVNDPEFLIAADRWRLLPRLATVTDTEARKSASAFETTQYLLPNQPPGQALAQLDLAARIHDATMLIDGISHLPYKRPWTVAWGHWAPPDRHVLLGRHAAGVLAIATATIDGAPLAFTGSRDGTVRVWDLRTRTACGGPLYGHPGKIETVAVCDVGSTPVAVTGGIGGALVWNLRVWRPFDSYADAVQAVAVGEVDGSPVAVTGGIHSVRAWDLRTGASHGRRFRGRTKWVEALAVGEVDGTPVAVTCSRDGPIQAWDLRAGRPRGEPLLPGGFFRRLIHRSRSYQQAAQAVAVGTVAAAPVAVTGSHDGTVCVWDLRTGTAHQEPLRGHPGGVLAVAVGEVDDTPVAVTGDLEGVQVWDLRAGVARGEPLRGHAGPVEAVAVEEVDGAVVAVTGGRDGTVRMWDLRAVARGEALGGHAGRVDAVAVGEVDGALVAVTGGRDGTVRMWDLRAGAMRGELLWAHPGGVRTVAIGRVDGTPVAVTGGRNSTVLVWDLRAGVARGERLRGFTGWVEAVAVGEVDGSAVAIFGGVDGLQVWDLPLKAARGKPLLPGSTLRRHLHPLSELERAVQAIAVGRVDGAPVAVTGGFDGTVRMWDLRTRRARGKPLRAHSEEVHAVAVGEVDGTPVAVTGGRDGMVCVWDLRAGAIREQPLRAHSGGIRAVAVGEVYGIPVAVSGDDNGTILMWVLNRDQRVSARVDVTAGITAIVFVNGVGWLTSTKDGSLFIWRSASTSATMLGRSWQDP